MIDARKSSHPQGNADAIPGDAELIRQFLLAEASKAASLTDAAVLVLLWGQG